MLSRSKSESISLSKILSLASLLEFVRQPGCGGVISPFEIVIVFERIPSIAMDRKYGGYLEE